MKAIVVIRVVVDIIRIVIVRINAILVTMNWAGSSINA